jgi:hypothetical protein
VLEALVDYFHERKAPEVAVSMLASLRHQFSGDARVAVDRLHQCAEAEVQARQERYEQAKVEALAARKRARLRYYRERLERAKVRGDKAAATALSDAITKLQRSD